MARIIKRLEDYVTTNIALNTESQPFFALYEVFVVGMSNEISQNSRLMGFVLGFAGLSEVYKRGRELFKKVLRISDKTSELAHIIYDASYCGLFSLAFLPPIYYAAGSRDLNEIAAGTGCGIMLGVINGAPAGYALDVFKDLTGLEECKRRSYPEFIKKQNPKIKKVIAAGLVALSIGAMSLIYLLNPRN